MAPFLIFLQEILVLHREYFSSAAEDYASAYVFAVIS